MRVPLFIAGRYLFAKKSHNVIDIISAISVIGLAVGTAALVIILSIYNGFDQLIKEHLQDFDSDIRIESTYGKTFNASDSLYNILAQYGKVDAVIEETVFANYAGRQDVGFIKAYDGAVCNVGAGLAQKLAISPRFLTPLELYFPERGKNISISNPTASLKSIKVWPEGVVNINSDVDASLITLPIQDARELLGYKDEISAYELRTEAAPGSKTINEIRRAVGPDFKVLDRYAQHPSLYRMMRYEKLSIYMILIFVVLIVAFNVYGSLSMLIIEKKGDIATLSAVGANTKTIRRTFALEGWMVCILGMLIGLVIGVAVAWIQQETGLIKMPGSYVLQPYPVNLEWTDILTTGVGVTLVGLLISVIPPLRTLDPKQEAE